MSTGVDCNLHLNLVLMAGPWKSGILYGSTLITT